MLHFLRLLEVLQAMVVWAECHDRRHGVAYTRGRAC
jgi:hypothetical protein